MLRDEYGENATIDNLRYILSNETVVTPTERRLMQMRAETVEEEDGVRIRCIDGLDALIFEVRDGQMRAPLFNDWTPCDANRIDNLAHTLLCMRLELLTNVLTL